MVAIKVPDHYGWVVLGAGIAPVVTSLVLQGYVMEAREKYNVQYPNLYAVPGVHDKADEFNRVQRGHQNFLENTDGVVVMCLLGGLKHPIASAVASGVYCLGCVFYMRGYADNSLDVKDARYKKGGEIKWLGYLTSFVCCGSFAFDLITA